MSAKEMTRLTADQALRVISIDSVGFDESYQRDVKRKHKRIISEFETEAIGVPIVAEREDGSLWCVDGRQRLTALKALGFKVVRVNVFRSEGSSHEARIFNLINRGRTSLTPGELFKASVESQDPDALLVVKITKEFGFEVGASGLRNQEIAAKMLRCHTTLMNAVAYTYSDDGEAGEVLRDTLDILSKIWEIDGKRTDATIVQGLVLFFLKYKTTVDKDRLIKRLSLKQPAKLLYSATLGASGKGTNMCELIEKEYRKRGVRG